MVASPKMPEVRYPDPPPPAPERSDAQTQALAASQRELAQRRFGRANTVLNNSNGETSAAIRLLGGAART